MLKVDPAEIKYTFSKSSGSGGQNVNKLYTHVTLIWSMVDSKSISNGIKARFQKLFKGFINDRGEVVIKSQRHRSQKRNIDDANMKLRSMLIAAAKEPKKRKATRPTRSSVRKRLEKKKQHSEKKKSRRQKF
ncbi:MAG: aminoacyl-tRNA hydrolase [Halobacteriovoraceae bacterium]|nr:aminoacyl-tRNA hydrolase [Halobacteriovoraceae bacterium]|tara:strand:- start:114 stop:509 length:396 start_codon:yes stop_codon:yes gene_type:complete